MASQRSEKDLSAEIKQCLDQISILEKELWEKKSKQTGESEETTLMALASKKNLTSLGSGRHPLRLRKFCRGHFGKIYAIAFPERTSPENDNILVSAAQDGKLIVWDALSTNKLRLFPLRSAWVMTVAVSSSTGLVASGGLDNTCSVFRMSSGITGYEEKAADSFVAPSYELQKHDGYISSVKFLGEDKIATASGDSQIFVWDLQKAHSPIATMIGHQSDVMSITSDSTGNLIISGACDCSCRVFDLRVSSVVNASSSVSSSSRGGCVAVFEGYHESDVNCVTMFPNDMAFGTASDDSSCRLFDLRSKVQVGVYQSNRLVSPSTSIGFSSSGRMFFSGYDDHSVHVWDTLTGEQLDPTFQQHENRVSCLSVNSSGSCVATGSWDSNVRCFA